MKTILGFFVLLLCFSCGATLQEIKGEPAMIQPRPFIYTTLEAAKEHEAIKDTAEYNRWLSMKGWCRGFEVWFYLGSSPSEITIIERNGDYIKFHSQYLVGWGAGCGLDMTGIFWTNKANIVDETQAK